jgi:hypothetical protein
MTADRRANVKLSAREKAAPTSTGGVRGPAFSAPRAFPEGANFSTWASRRGKPRLTWAAGSAFWFPLTIGFCSRAIETGPRGQPFVTLSQKFVALAAAPGAYRRHVG